MITRPPKSRRGFPTLAALMALGSGIVIYPAQAITTPEPILPPILSAPQNSAGAYDVSWSPGFDTVMLYESPNGTTNWTKVYHGDATATTSKSFNYDYSGIRYYKARGCASINGNVPSCSNNSTTISVSTSGRLAKPVTAVVLGDSFSSGEGGRWRGNTNDENSRYSGYMGTDSAGFDLANLPPGYRGNPGAQWDKAYEQGSISNGCHRAYSAPIHQLYGEPYFPIPPLMIRRGPFEKTVNLACSGGRNKHLWPLAEGGESFKGEAPQISQLANLNLTHDVKLIAVGIGGNDMGFSSAITACAAAWTGKVLGWDAIPGIDDRCDTYIADNTVPELWDVYAKVAKTINLIRLEMLRQGKTDPDDYRIVLMGYPAIIAGPSDNRYAGLSKLNPGHCPFNNSDARYIEETLMPKLNGLYETLAHIEQVDFINPKDLFQGHKLCQTGAQRASSTVAATAGNMEWVRYIDHDLDTSGAIQSLWDYFVNGTEIAYGKQGRVQESMHPNQFGQQALGSCYRKWWSQRSTVPGPYTCTNANPDSTQHVKVAPLAAPTSAHTSAAAPIPDAELYHEDPPPGGGDDPTPPPETKGVFVMPGELQRHFTVSGIDQEEPGRMARIELAIDHPAKGDLRIFLRSPSGTEHPIKGENPFDHTPFPSVWRSYLTYAGLEPGQWSLVIQDTRTANTGTFQGFSIYWF